MSVNTAGRMRGCGLESSLIGWLGTGKWVLAGDAAEG
jgi:hypothetical protein